MWFGPRDVPRDVFCWGLDCGNPCRLRWFRVELDVGGVPGAVSSGGDSDTKVSNWPEGQGATHLLVSCGPSERLLVILDF